MTKQILSIAILSLALLILTLAVSLPAQSTNRLIPFQGRLTDGFGKELNGVYTMIFNIYDEPTGGTSLWAETHRNVSVIAGQVNVILGSMTSLDDPDNNAATDNPLHFVNPRYLGITIGTASSQEMLPRHQLVPSFQARISDRAFKADNATNAENSDNAKMLNNKLPSYYASARSVEDVSADIRNKIDTVNTKITNVSNALRNILPAGTVLAYASGNVPSGFLKANGQYVNKRTYAALYAAIGNTYGSTSSDFRLPDYRGYFLRGWDNGRGADPDRGSRGNRGDGNGGDNVGTVQGHQVYRHNHNYGSYRYLLRAIGRYTKTVHDSSPHEPDIRHKGAIQPYGGNETRPKNISVMYIIKY